MQIRKLKSRGKVDLLMFPRWDYCKDFWTCRSTCSCRFGNLNVNQDCISMMGRILAGEEISWSLVLSKAPAKFFSEALIGRLVLYVLNSLGSRTSQGTLGFLKLPIRYCKLLSNSSVSIKWSSNTIGHRLNLRQHDREPIHILELDPGDLRALVRPANQTSLPIILVLDG